MSVILWLLFAAGPSALWDDVARPHHARCLQLLEDGKKANSRNGNAEAVRAFTEATRLCPDEPQPFTLLGTALVDVGDFAAARPALERARALYGDEGGDPHLAFHLGFARALSGDLEGSLIEYRRALTLGGLGLADNWLVHYDLGDTLMALGRLAEATDSYKRAVRAAPLKPITHLALAVAYDRDHQLEKARHELGIVLSQDPLLHAAQSDQFIFVPTADRHYYLALGFFARGLKSRARWELRQFLQKVPEGPYSPRARERLAQAENASGAVEIRRVLDGQVTELEPCIQRGWKGPLVLSRAAGQLRMLTRQDACLNRWVDRVSSLLPPEDFQIDLEVTPK